MQSSPVTEKVTQERWQDAQKWEEHHWVNAQRMRARYFKNIIWRAFSSFGVVDKYRGDDWNFWWRKQFDEYKFLPGTVENAIEVGCGPYTNVRLMLDRCSIKHLVLSDPLIRTYVRFKLTFVREMYQKAACMLDDHALEELPFAPNYFDLAVMINVLDHVQDAGRCMENLTKILRPGGWLIIGQDLTDEEDLNALKNDPGATGHPIKLDHAWFDLYLQNFQPTLKKVLNREQSREPHQHYGALIFAGRKN
jgi:SAM-dependent methyltransferase